MSRSDLDVVVVGAGIEGLVAAALLARAHARVVVLEREAVVGGAAVPISVGGASDVVACAAMPMVGPLRRTLFEALRLGRRGVRLSCPDPLAWTPLADGRALAIRAEPAKTSAELRAFSTQDAAVWARFGLWRQSLARRIEPLLRAGNVPLERVARAIRGEAHELSELLFASVAEIAQRHFETPALVASIAQFATSGTTLGPRDAGTFFHLVLRGSADLFGPPGAWGHVLGGTGRLAVALGEAASEAGAQIRTRTEVRHVDVARGTSAASS